MDVARSEARSFGSMAASKERDAHRRLEGLQDELEHANEQVRLDFMLSGAKANGLPYWTAAGW